jgi:hypothetical protein
MPPKHRQPHAPHPKASGTTFQALVDPPNDGNNLCFDRGDERTDGNDDNTVVVVNPHDSELPASPEPQYEPPAIQKWLWDLQTSILRSSPREGLTPARIPQILEVLAATNMLLAYSNDHNMAAHHEMNERLYKIEERVIALKTDQYQLFDDVNSKMDNLLQKMDAAWTENTALRDAYGTSRGETAALTVAVDTRTKKLDENITTTAPFSPATATSSTTMEGMTMRLSHVQHDIQDVLDAIHNPPGKRKRCTSHQDNEPTMLMNRRLATQRHRDASPEHSMMHSRHATSAAQEALDALMIKYPPR